MVRIGFLKVGNIATAPMVEMLLDERAEREDMEVRCLTSGANMGSKQSEKVATDMLALKPDLVFVVSPNAATKGPTKARGVFSEAGIPTIVVSDGPKKLLEELGEKGMGGIIIEADSMIGARREFLDPIEMAVFNADTIKVLSVTGVFNLVYKVIDDLIEQLKAGKKPELPLLLKPLRRGEGCRRLRDGEACRQPDHAGVLQGEGLGGLHRPMRRRPRAHAVCCHSG